MESLRIRANMENGFYTNDIWSPSIDGIMSFFKMKNVLGDSFYDYMGRNDDSEFAEKEIDLPLKRTEYNGLWWYNCSIPLYKTINESKKFYHRRFDDQYERYIDGKIKKVNISSGTFKNFRMKIIKILTKYIDWYVIGDKRGIEYLLSECNFVGKKYSQGMGKVISWEVKEIDDNNNKYAEELRPLPLKYANDNQKLINKDHTCLMWGIHPPFRLKDNQTTCIMPLEFNYECYQ
jgi:CRISPR type IV-associated protein Csf3